MMVKCSFAGMVTLFNFELRLKINTLPRGWVLAMHVVNDFNRFCCCYPSYEADRLVLTSIIAINEGISFHNTVESWNFYPGI